MNLETENGALITLANFDEVRNALSNLKERGDGFVIVKDGERMIQTAFDGDRLVVEKSEGADDPLYRASRNGSEEFALTDVEEFFRSWYEHTPMPAGVQWSVEDQGGTTQPKALLLAVLFVVAGCIIYALVRSR